MQKGLVLAMDIGHEMLRSLGEAKDGFQADDFRAGGLHGGILRCQQGQIAQSFSGKIRRIIHRIYSSELARGNVL